jgi:predicted transposase YbfD/YdcC
MNVFTHFEDIDDPRVERTKKHKLFDIIVLSICAVIANADTFVEIERYGKAKYDWLKTFLELPHGIPSHDTIGRVFSLLDPQLFYERFQQWISEIVELVNGEIIAIDGKTVRRSFDNVKGTSAIHLVSAWARENRICIGQKKVDDKSNEIRAIPELIEELCIKDCIITIDAMGTQKEIAQRIIAAEADYVLALKGNQGVLQEDVQLFFEDAAERAFQDIPHDYTKTVTNDHGRIEVREYWITSAIGWLSNKHDWKKLTSIGMVKSVRSEQTRETEEIRFFITSLPPDAAVFADAVRGHWSVENSLHWVLDIAFKEDDIRARDRYAAENLSILRKIALNLIKQEKSRKIGVSAKRKNAAWDNAYLMKILSGN